VMLGEDIMGKIFSCMGEKDDTVAKGLLEGKVRFLSPSLYLCLGDTADAAHPSLARKMDD